MDTVFVITILPFTFIIDGYSMNLKPENVENSSTSLHNIKKSFVDLKSLPSSAFGIVRKLPMASRIEDISHKILGNNEAPYSSSSKNDPISPGSYEEKISAMRDHGVPEDVISKVIEHKADMIAQQLAKKLSEWKRNNLEMYSAISGSRVDASRVWALIAEDKSLRTKYTLLEAEYNWIMRSLLRRPERQILTYYHR